MARPVVGGEKRILPSRGRLACAPQSDDSLVEMLLLAGVGVDAHRFAAEEQARHDQQQRFAEQQTGRRRAPRPRTPSR
jgi:hypothetical protein